MAEREPVIGIDLGTTNTVLATVTEGIPTVIPNRSGGRLTPSVVALARNGRRLVGQLAKRQAVTNPERTLYATKRLIGRKFSSEPVGRARKVLPYPVVAGEHDDVRVKLGEEILSLPEISAAILAELKRDAEAHFGRPVTKAVITVPAYFNDGQRQATKDAGQIAGLEVLRILNEPTAAALAFGANRPGANGKIAVFDLGGGTFDVSILSIGSGVYDVLATGGDTYLGGEDFDHRVLDFLAMGFAKEHGIDLRRDRMALQRLRESSEKAKIELSSASEAQVNLPFVHTPEGGGAALHLQTTLTREQLEALTSDLRERTCALFSQVLSEARLKPADLSDILFVGGMTRMPRIHQEVRERFGKEPCKGVHPDEVVALGAAVHAEVLTAPKKREVVLLDVTPQNLGVAVTGGWVRTLIPKNTTIPTSTSEVFHTSRDGQTLVKIMVLQGEHAKALDNELLGEFVLEGIREAPRGQVEIEVTFEIDSEGIVSVSAKDKETGMHQSLVVTASGGLTREELAAILESRKNDLLSAAPSPEAKKAREEAESLARQVEALVARLGNEAFEVAAAKRAEAALSAMKSAMADPRPEAWADASSQLGRIQQVLQAVLGASGEASR